MTSGSWIGGRASNRIASAGRVLEADWTQANFPLSGTRSLSVRMTLTHDSPPPRAHGHRTSLILIALVLGIVAGFVFGEYCVSLQVIGDAFVGLLQMTVLPYIVVSLIASFGKLSLLQSRRLISIGGAVLLTLWAIGLAAVYVVPHSFPVWKAGSFFSTAAIEPAVKPDWVPLFIPGNVFGALAENQIPAVVVFCIAVGLALGAIPQKDALVDQLERAWQVADSCE